MTAPISDTTPKHVPSPNGVRVGRGVLFACIPGLAFWVVAVGVTVWVLS